MNELQKVSNNQLALTNPNAKAVDIRRAISEIVPVMDKLTTSEAKVYSASTKFLIRDVKDMAKFVKEVYVDLMESAYLVGFKVTSNEEMVILSNSIAEYLYDYKKNLAFAEFKLAFKLLASKELDDFFDRKEDKEHFQSFSYKYVIGVLAAYDKMRNNTFKKAREEHQKLLDVPREKSDEEKRVIHNASLDLIKDDFIQFLGFENTEFSVIQAMRIYDWMQRIGVGSVEVTTGDLQQAYRDYSKDIYTGIVNHYNRKSLIEEGIDSPKLKGRAMDIARSKLVKEYFSKLKAEETNIETLLDYKQ